MREDFFTPNELTLLLYLNCYKKKFSKNSFGIILKNISL